MHEHAPLCPESAGEIWLCCHNGQCKNSGLIFNAPVNQVVLTTIRDGRQ